MDPRHRLEKGEPIGWMGHRYEFRFGFSDPLDQIEEIIAEGRRPAPAVAELHLHERAEALQRVAQLLAQPASILLAAHLCGSNNKIKSIHN